MLDVMYLSISEPTNGERFTKAWSRTWTYSHPQRALSAGILLPDQTHQWLVWGVRLPLGQSFGTQQKSTCSFENFPQWHSALPVYQRYPQTCCVVGSWYSASCWWRQWSELSATQLGPVPEATTGQVWEQNRPKIRALCGSPALRVGKTGSLWFLITSKRSDFIFFFPLASICWRLQYVHTSNSGGN